MFSKPEISEFMNTDTPSGKFLSLGLDDEGHLYVNGNRVVTEQHIDFDWWVNVAVVAGGVGALAQGIIAVVTFFK